MHKPELRLGSVVWVNSCWLGSWTWLGCPPARLPDYAKISMGRERVVGPVIWVRRGKASRTVTSPPHPKAPWFSLLGCIWRSVFCLSSCFHFWAEAGIHYFWLFLLAFGKSPFRDFLGWRGEASLLVGLKSPMWNRTFLHKKVFPYHLLPWVRGW